MSVIENNNEITSLQIAKEAVRVMVEKQGIDIKLYDVKDKTSVTEFYLNVTGRSTSHVASLSDDLCEALSKIGLTAKRIEGRGPNNWLLIDYYDLVVNIFDKQTRDFYSLDRLIGEECAVDIEDVVKEIDEKYTV